MSPVTGQARSLIDFEGYITDRTARFTGREWVFAEIDRWLGDEAGQRAFLLTGELGAGKTTIAAQLARIANGSVSAPAGLSHVGAGFLAGYHFCNGRDSRWIDPVTFSKSLALQFATKYPGFVEALVETSSQGKFKLEAAMNIGSVSGGQVVANWINTLNISAISGQEAFGLLVREPLEKVLQPHTGGRAVILIDALDESLLSTAADNILTLVASAEEWKSVRFIVASGQNSRVENSFMGAPNLFLSANQYYEKNKTDIAAFARAQFPAGTATADAVDQIAEKADGNFQYVTFLLDAMAKGHLAMADVRSLPPGLDVLYYKSIDQAVKVGKKDWATAYRPVLGVLCVARENLTAAQLQQFTSQTETAVSDILTDFEQVVAETPPVNGQGESTYRIFHQSFTDMLGAPKIGGGANKNLYCIPPAEQHQRIAEYYRQGRAWKDIEWNSVDDYGLLHLPNHTDQLRDVDSYKTALYDLISAPLLWARWSRYTTHGPFADDTRLLIKAATFRKPPDVPVQIRGALILSTLHSMVSDTPPEALRALALAGFWEHAYWHAALIADTKKRQDALIMVQQAMVKTGNPRARELFREISEGLLPGNLPSAAPALAEYGELDRIAPVLALVAGDKGAQLRHRIVESLCDAGKYDAALTVAESIEEKVAQVEGISRVIGALRAASAANAGPLTDSALSTARSLPDPAEKATALSYIAEALSRSGPEDLAKQIGLEALETVDGVAPQWSLMDTVCRLAPVLAEYGELPRVCTAALRIADHDAATAESIESAVFRAPESVSESDFQSLVSRTEAMAAKMMANRFTCLSVISQVPEPGEVVFRGGLRNDDIRANAISWIAQTIAAEPKQPGGKQISQQLQAALDAIPAGEAGMKEVALGYVALILAKSGESDAVKHLIDKIFDMLRSRPVRPEIYQDLLMAICPALGRIGDIERAISITQPIKKQEDNGSKDTRDDIWSAMARHLLRTPDTANAIGISQMIKDPEKREKALIDIVQNASDGPQYKISDILEALGEADNSFADRLPPGPRERVQSNVASRLADLGLNQRAAWAASRVIKASDAMSNSQAKARALASIGSALIAAGLAEQGAEVAEEALATIGSDPDAILETLDAVRTLARAGRFDRALSVVQTIDDEWRNKGFALRDVAAIMAQGGDVERALQTARLIRSVPVQAEALIGIAQSLSERAETGESAKLIDEAVDLARPVEKGEPAQKAPRKLIMAQGEPDESGPVSWKIVRALTAADRRDQAMGIAQAMAEVPASDPSQGAQAALCLLLAGDKDRGEKLAEDVLEQMPLVDFTPQEALALALIARLFGLADRFDRAVEIVQTIFKTRGVSDHTSDQLREYARLNTAMEIAGALEEKGRSDEAVGVLDSVLTRLEVFSKPADRVRYKGRVLQAYVRMGRQPRAASLWQEQLATAQSDNRLCFFDVLRYGAPMLANIDKGQTLSSIWQSIREVETWWKMPVMG